MVLGINAAISKNYFLNTKSEKKSSNLVKSKQKPTPDEMVIKRMKRAIYESSYAVIGVGIIYFLAKRNKIVNVFRKREIDRAVQISNRLKF